jgi:hypothetical protein
MQSTTSVIELLERWSIDDFSVHRAVDDALLVTVRQREGDAERFAEFRRWLRATPAFRAAEEAGLSYLLPEPDGGIDGMVRARVGEKDVVFLFQTKATAAPMPPQERSTYDVDFAAWARRQAALIRAGHWEHIDASNVADEIDDLSKRQQHELRSRLRVLIVHVLKWDHQPERRSRSWALTIREQQVRIEDVLAVSPSLQALLVDYVQAVYESARDLAALETGLPDSTFPPAMPYTVEQVLSIRPKPEDQA